MMKNWCVHHAQLSLLDGGLLDLRCEYVGGGDNYETASRGPRGVPMTCYVLRWRRDLCSHEAQLDAIRANRTFARIVRVAVRGTLEEALRLAKKWEREMSGVSP